MNGKNSIERISLINKNNIDQKNYFSSLLSNGILCNLLDENDIQNIQLQCISLLSGTIKRYTGGQSSSIPIKDAKRLMESNAYTIGLCLKSFSNPDDAILELKEKEISQLYDLGKERLNKLIVSTKLLYKIILNNLVSTDNIFYNETIIGGIEGFFKLYNIDYEAHEIHITADYVLCNGQPHLSGIEFISKYLELFNYENLFCKNFDDSNINNLLKRCNYNYQELLVNVYEQVLTTAIGCIIANADVRKLQIDLLQLEEIYLKLVDKTEIEINDIIRDAYKKLLSIISISSATREYTEKSLNKIVTIIINGINTDKLEHVFGNTNFFDETKTIYFSFKEQMENEKYRYVLNKFNNCHNVTEKVDIIRSNISSLNDLVDLLIDSETVTKEIKPFFDTLTIIEIAALKKKYQDYQKFGIEECKESESKFISAMNNYILSLPNDKQDTINKITFIIKIDS